MSRERIGEERRAFDREGKEVFGERLMIDKVVGKKEGKPCKVVKEEGRHYKVVRGRPP